MHENLCVRRLCRRCRNEFNGVNGCRCSRCNSKCCIAIYVHQLPLYLVQQQSGSNQTSFVQDVFIRQADFMEQQKYLKHKCGIAATILAEGVVEKNRIFKVELSVDKEDIPPRLSTSLPYFLLRPFSLGIGLNVRFPIYCKSYRFA